MNTALKVYPNTNFEFFISQQPYSIIWEADSDQILVKRAKRESFRRPKAANGPRKLDFVANPEERRANATYSVSIENNRLRLKYMDGHRFQSVIVQ